MSKKKLTCIGCPKGCNLEIEIKDGKFIGVSGYSCKKGEEYGKKEFVNPTRIVTSSVKIIGGDLDVLPVKTEKDIPKEKIFDVIKELKNISVKAPINVGDIIIENVLGTGVNVVSTQAIK